MRNLNNRVFVKNILIISSLLWLILFVLNLLGVIGIPMTEVLTSWIISLINFFVGVKLFLFSLDKPNKQFMVFSLGSIILRLFIIIPVVVVLIVVFKFQKNLFILPFLGFYFIYLIFEIYLLNKYTEKSKG
jgi:hypothetical protein